MLYHIYCPPSHHLLSYTLSSTLTVDRAILQDARKWGWRIDAVPLPRSKSSSATVEYLDSRYKSRPYARLGASSNSGQGGDSESDRDFAIPRKLAVGVSNHKDKDDTSRDSRRWIEGEVAGVADLAGGARTPSAGRLEGEEVGEGC